MHRISERVSVSFLFFFFLVETIDYLLITADSERFQLWVQRKTSLYDRNLSLTSFFDEVMNEWHSYSNDNNSALWLSKKTIKVKFGLIKTLRIFTKSSKKIFFGPPTLREKCMYSELFWSAFSRIRTEYGEMRSILVFSPNGGKCRPE